MDHLMSRSTLAFLDAFYKLKSTNLVQMQAVSDKGRYIPWYKPGLGSIQFRNWNCSSIPIPELELELKLVELKMELELKSLELELELKTGIEFFCNCYHSTYWLTNHFQILFLTEEVTIFQVTDSSCNRFVF